APRASCVLCARLLGFLAVWLVSWIPRSLTQRRQRHRQYQQPVYSQFAFGIWTRFFSFASQGRTSATAAKGLQPLFFLNSNTNKGTRPLLLLLLLAAAAAPAGSWYDCCRPVAHIKQYPIPIRGFTGVTVVEAWRWRGATRRARRRRG
ncbi:unnamed protein product, partial [Laminaria digitata]